MKYSLKYFSTSKRMDLVDELVIKYTKYTPELIEFISNRPKHQRVVVYCKDYELTEDDIDLFREAEVITLVENRPNFVLELQQSISKEMLNYIKSEAEIPFFFDTYITTKDALYDIIQKGVSDVRLMGSICFDLENIYGYCIENNVNVRVTPNLAQSNGFDPHGLKDFFIRPDDIWLYEDYIDICEFYGPLDRQDVLFDIYRDERWQGYLDELIIGFKEDERINCMNIIPDFGKHRIHCQRRCILYNKCNFCDICKSLAKTLNDKDIYITKDKRKYEYDANESAMQDSVPESI